MNFKYIKQLAEKKSLILGSSSPRRKRILNDLGINFSQVTPQVEEDVKPGEKPFAYAVRLAGEKALDVVDDASPDNIILGCDTIVLLEENDKPGQMLGKPTSEQEAMATLSLLSGKHHIVATALALIYNNEIVTSDFEKTRVFFNKVTNRELLDYIATGEPMDKAGAYGIQGMGAFLVDRIEGNLDNVIGLPCHLLDKMARYTLERIGRVD